MRTTIPVTVENFVRAEADQYFDGLVKRNGFGRFAHARALAPVASQLARFSNRDTLYSGAIFDLDAGDVMIALPDARGRFVSLQAIDEDQYTHAIVHDRGPHVLSRDDVGTRYVLAALRIFVDPDDAKDVATVHALQDAIVVHQAARGSFELPEWDSTSHARVRDALRVLGGTIPDCRHGFGARDGVDPLHFLVGSALSRDEHPETDVTCVLLRPERNDGRTPHTITLRDVPVDGFWSISAYDADGDLIPNPLHAHTVNDVTAATALDGSITVRFGRCSRRTPNCLPIAPGWTCLVRLYRPRPEALDGSWRLPAIEPLR
jgi:hypothetical protein